MRSRTSPVLAFAVICLVVAVIWSVNSDEVDPECVQQQAALRGDISTTGRQEAAEICELMGRTE